VGVAISAVARPAPARSRGRRHAEGVQLKTWRASMKLMSFGESDIALFCWCAFRCPLGIRRASPPSRSSGHSSLPASGRTGVGRALEAGFELGLEAFDLLARQVAVARRIDDGAGGPRRVGEQRLLSCAPPARRSTWTRCCAGRSPGRRPPAGSQLLHGLKHARNSPNDLAMW
jgi:hypothetical protein